MCFFKLMAFACFVVAAATSDPPAGSNPVEETDGNYTVLYNGPEGSHWQTGEPGKAVKGFYTFFDSRGRKQKVTYQADERGYRVTSTAIVLESQEVSPTTRRPRIIEKITPKLQAGVLFTKKTNEPQMALPNSGTSASSRVESTTEVKSMVSEDKFVTTDHPVNMNKEFEKDVVESSVSTHAKGQVTFKEPQVLLNYDIAYNMGYPFVAGIYIYAL